MKCDLHIHSKFSDGIFTPEQLVETAKEKGLDCIAITDHDTFDGVAQGKKRADELGLGYVIGAEFSSMAHTEVHVLGYNLDITSPTFAVEMGKIANLRNQRNEAIIAKLKAHGIIIDLQALQKQGSVGRAVIAREMVAQGHCKDVPDAFARYLGAGQCCYANTERLTPVEAVRFILRYGGIPVLAHPKQLRLDFADFEKFLKPLVLSGLGGIEAQYFTHNNAERNFFSKMAKKYKLIITGGSDFHDYVHGVTLGTKSFSPNSYTRKILGI